MTEKERNKTEPREHKVTNPYSGQSEMLTATEYAYYFLTKYAERIEDYDAMQKSMAQALLNTGQKCAKA